MGRRGAECALPLGSMARALRPLRGLRDLCVKNAGSGGLGLSESWAGSPCHARRTPSWDKTRTVRSGWRTVATLETRATGWKDQPRYCGCYRGSERRGAESAPYPLEDDPPRAHARGHGTGNGAGRPYRVILGVNRPVSLKPKPRLFQAGVLVESESADAHLNDSSSPAVHGLGRAFSLASTSATWSLVIGSDLLPHSWRM